MTAYLKFSRQHFDPTIARAIQADDEKTFIEACTRVGISPGDCRSSSRRPHHCAARAVVAHLLSKAGWTQERIGALIHRTKRQIKRLLKK